MLPALRALRELPFEHVVGPRWRKKAFGTGEAHSSGDAAAGIRQRTDDLRAAACERVAVEPGVDQRAAARGRVALEDPSNLLQPPLPPKEARRDRRCGIVGPFARVVVRVDQPLQARLVHGWNHDVQLVDVTTKRLT